VGSEAAQALDHPIRWVRHVPAGQRRHCPSAGFSPTSTQKASLMPRSLSAPEGGAHAVHRQRRPSRGFSGREGQPVTPQKPPPRASSGGEVHGPGTAAGTWPCSSCLRPTTASSQGKIRCSCLIVDQFTANLIGPHFKPRGPHHNQVAHQACSQTSRLKSNLKGSTGPASRGRRRLERGSGLGEADAGGSRSRPAGDGIKATALMRGGLGARVGV